MQMPTPDAAILAKRDRILSLLSAALPADALISDPLETRAYECDALTAYRCLPLAVTLPRTTEEVAAILRICHAEGVKVIRAGRALRLRAGHCPRLMP